MDIVASFNPPRLVELGGEPYWVRCMTLEDFAVLVAWLDDVTPGRAGRLTGGTFPRFGDDHSQLAMDSPHGKAVMAWVVLRHQGVSYLDAARLSIAATAEEWYRLLDVAFGRRRTLVPGEGDEEISQQWWGPILTTLAERYGLEAMGRISLDQLDSLATEGVPDERPGRLSPQQVQDLWLASRPAESTDG